MLKATVVTGNYQWHQVKAWSLQKVLGKKS